MSESESRNLYLYLLKEALHIRKNLVVQQITRDFGAFVVAHIVCIFLANHSGNLRNLSTGVFQVTPEARLEFVMFMWLSAGSLVGSSSLLHNHRLG